MAKEKLDEDTLKALLSDEIRSAITYDATELSERRARAMEYYRGEMTDTPSMAGRSSVTSRDIADTIGWMLPGIIRVFTASDQMAIAEPVKPGDEDVADQATDYLNHIFWKDNPGYRILWDATHDSLLQGNGIVKHYWDDKEECEYSEHSGMTEEQIAILLSENNGQPNTYGDEKQPGVEVVAQKPGQPQTIVMQGPDGQTIQQEVETFDIKVKRVTMNGRVRVECLKPEDFLIDKDAVCIEDARFVAHRDEVTRSDLIEMGFSKAQVEDLPDDHYSHFSEESLAREENRYNYNDVGHKSTRLIELYECYIKADADGDGIAETIRAYFAGGNGSGHLLDWEVWDDAVPFSDIPCEPVPHRWDARSVADETMDLQRIQTVLTRQLLDNLYWVNTPMNEAEEGTVNNPEMLKAPKFGGTIWRKKGTMASAGPIKPLSIPFIGDKALLGIQHFNTVREMRTGVSRSTMALDPETLQNQTATANQNQKDASYSQVELIARNQAELGWKRVFKEILALTIKHQDRPRVIRLRDEWVEIDPRHWNAGMDITINVGLGTGSRDRDMMMLKSIGEAQFLLTDRLMGAGVGDVALEMLPKIIETMKKAAESAGLKNPEQFFPEIDETRLQQIMAQMAERAKQPDPKIAAEMQKTQMQIQADREKAANDMRLQTVKMEREFQLKEKQMFMEMNLKERQLAAELSLKERLATQEMEMKREQGFYKTDAMASAKTSGVSMGGKPS